ncbi:MAG: 30S ribosomal protein S20 [bacterium]
MAITKSAKKAQRVSKKRHLFNVRRKRALGDATKEVKKLIAAGKAVDAEKLLAKAQEAIDKAAKSGVIKANAASRKKSRLVKAIRRIGK